MIYTPLVTGTDIVEGSTTTVTTALWSNNSGSYETELFTSQTQINTSGEYYVDVYDKDPTGADAAEVQFAITYGHVNGGGAPTLVDNEQGTLPTKAIYSQYRSLLLNPDDSRFSFQGVNSDHIYVINFQRARTKQFLDPGNWQLPLSGANGILTFIDDSNDTVGALQQSANSKAGRVYSIVSGALTTISGSATSSINSKTWGTSGPGYGLVYPDLGLIILNPDAIGPAVGFFRSGSSTNPNTSFSPYTGSAATGNQYSPFYKKSTLATNHIPYAPVTAALSIDTAWNSELGAFNHAGLYQSINLATNSPNYSDGFRARSAEAISSTHYFVRLRWNEYNYSNNPTFRDSTTGTFVQSSFKTNPQVYVTSVGLYNDNNELLAVAKLSKPVRKSFDEEVLLRVRLDF